MTEPLPSMARGACPALARPMLTGDGYLSRVALQAAIGPAALAGLAVLALRHGNGNLDISARGNLQIRGLTEASAAALEADVRALDLPLREGLAVEWTPLAGLDPAEAADPRPLGATIIAAARSVQGELAPKLSVVIETGGLIRLDHLLADIRLVAAPTADGLRWRVLLGGTAKNGTILGLVADGDAAELVGGLLVHLSTQGPRARGRDLEPANLPASLLALLSPGESTVAESPAPPFGIFALTAGLHALRVALPFGQMRAEDLAALTAQAAHAGILSLKPAPDHALIAVGSREACEALELEARAAHLLVRAGEPLSEIAACPGAPACRSARLETHSLGRLAAEQAPLLFDGSVRLHLSGCQKGCAHPTPSTLAFAGTEGATHLVFEGKTTDTPLKRLAPQTEAAALSALSELMRLERRPGETSRDCLLRLGPRRIEAALA